MGFEPMNTGFADQRVSHFAIGAHGYRSTADRRACLKPDPSGYCGCAVVRR